MSSFSERLKELRLENRLTQEELAEKFYLNKSSISRYERGQQVPELELLKKIADYFGVGTDFLLGKSNIRNPYITEGIEVREEQEKYNVAKLDDDISIWFSKDEYSDDLPEDVKNSMRDYLRFLLKEHGKKKNE